MLDCTTLPPFSAAPPPPADPGYTVPVAALARLGRGNIAAGRRVLRELIAEGCSSEPITGPTERPASVRLARPEDEAALLDLMMLDLSENAAPLAPPDPERILLHIRGIGAAENARLGVIDGPDGKPAACICLMPVQWWWSSRWFVQEVWNFVHPDCRHSRHAVDLVTFSKWFADECSRNLGERVFLLSGVTALHRATSKVALYRRLSNYVGAFFVYPWPGGDVR